MLVASLSSCHMLSFLHLARMAGFTVTAYEDHAEGTTEEIAPGRLAVTKVKLRPKIEWAGAAPEKEALDRLHHQAHEICFIANSVKTQVRWSRAAFDAPWTREPNERCGQHPLQMLLSMLVILLLDLAIERRRTRCLRNAWPRHGFAGRRQIVLIQKMPRRRLVELRGHKTVVLPVSRNARGQPQAGRRRRLSILP